MAKQRSIRARASSDYLSEYFFYFYRSLFPELCETWFLKNERTFLWIFHDAEFAASQGIAPSREELQTPASESELWFLHFNTRLWRGSMGVCQTRHTPLYRVHFDVIPHPPPLSPSPGPRLIRRCTFRECEPLLVLVRQGKSNETPIRAHLR